MPQFQDGLVLPASVTDPAFPPVYSIGESVPLRVDNNGILQADVTGSIIAIIGNVTVDGEVTADATAFEPSTLPATPAASVNALRSDLSGRLLVDNYELNSYSRRFNNGLLINGRSLLSTFTFAWGVAAPTASLVTLYDNIVTGGTILWTGYMAATQQAFSIQFNSVLNNGLFIDGLNLNDARVTSTYRVIP